MVSLVSLWARGAAALNLLATLNLNLTANTVLLRSLSRPA